MLTFAQNKNIFVRYRYQGWLLQVWIEKYEEENVMKI